MSRLDAIVCPACLAECNVEGAGDGAFAACPHCRYEMNHVAPLSLRQLLDSTVETGATWNDVDLPAWTRMVWDEACARRGAGESGQ